MKILYPLLALAMPAFVTPAEAGPSAIVVVRHAEKADDGTRDPPLSAAGHARAGALAEALAGSEIGALLASGYRRTRQTLAVLAERHDLDIDIVAAGPDNVDAHIEAVVEAVRKADVGGVLVIAGHSNTAPLIVEALSGRAFGQLDESEYDRLFVLSPEESGWNVVSARYGAASADTTD